MNCDPRFTILYTSSVLPSPWPARFERAAFYSSWATAVAVLVSIAASQILLGLAFATLLISSAPLRLPRIRWLLALFLAGTLLSIAFSTDAAAGLPQLKKIFVYLTLVVVYSTFRWVSDVRKLVLSWAVVGASASVLAIVQFARKLIEAYQHSYNFYAFYVPQRITGFMSHWMTFSGEMMIVLAMLTAFLLFAPAGKRLFAVAGVAWGLIACGVVLGFTRAAWLGAAGAMLYLVWHSKRKLMWAAPVAVAGMLVAPGVRSRLVSTLRPHGQLDSNQHRIVCWRTGLNMIRAHPWFGVGPEIVGRKFMDYLPPDVKPPLPEGWYGHLHNIYLQYAAERGIPTGLALAAMLALMLADFTRAARRLPSGRSDLKFLLHGSAAAVIAVMIEGVAEHNLGDSEVLAMFLAVVATGYLGFDQAMCSPVEMGSEEAGRPVAPL